MNAPLQHKHHQQTLWLSAERTIFWEEESTLIISDLHFGKSGHFRKSGIAIPQSVFKNDMQRLFGQIQHYRPARIIIVGDMFHSKENLELDFFLKWRNDHAFVDIHLVKGNHDILKESWYAEASIQLSPQKLCVQNFHFVHDLAHIAKHEAVTANSDATPVEEVPKASPYYFTGHLHPGIRLRGLGRQALQFPCFYFGESHAILPAFGTFTGLAIIRPEEHETVFAIVDNQVIQIQ
jgi:uncharacterized protein